MSILSQSVTVFKKHWPALVLLQIPSASTEIIEFLIQPLIKNDWIAAGLALPFVLVGVALSAGATFIFIRSEDKSVGASFMKTLKQMPRLLMAFIGAGTITLLSLGAFFLPMIYAGSHIVAKAGGLFTLWGLVTGSLVLLSATPGLYYAAIYYFVPLQILDDPTAPILACFARSKRIVLTKLVRTIQLVVLVSVTDTLQYGIFGALASGMNSFFQIPGSEMTGVLCQTLGALAISPMIDVFVAYYYIQLKARDQ